MSLYVRTPLESLVTKDSEGIAQFYACQRCATEECLLSNGIATCYCYLGQFRAFVESHVAYDFCFFWNL